MKTILLLFSLFCVFTLSADESNDHHAVRILTKIKSKGDSILIQRPDGAAITGHLANKELEKDIAELEPGDDALIEGYISYESVIVEGSKSIQPRFTVTSIHPISLKRLGKVDMEDVDRFIPQDLGPHSLEPKAIPLSSRAINAMLLTASVLTVQSLTTSDETPQSVQNMNTMLFFSAGALATGYFIYDQIVNKVKD